MGLQPIQHPSHRSISAGRFALEWLFLAGLYLLFAGETSGEEIVAALAGGLVAAALRVLLVRSGRPYSDGFRGAARLFPRIAKSLLVDSVTVGTAFVHLLFTRRMLLGRFVEIPFDTGTSGPPSRTRRALVVGGISFAPNQYVAGLRFETGRLIVHQLCEAPTSKDEQWPV
ncbi:hypothetical protein [Rubellimicrobium mesophilum]|uniref:hypothetical protein n=1 Tax=Rubellimicrobium mesophilum TaxID=1123067 RepID=UPI00055D9A59|nr:hypothetical protein [Rubellimicrobium mesophilum]